ncbi:MAG TPA: terpene cyclase/mutase family protein [Kiritimatiellia bacterium]|nr:terpene cyclase/mutase family protein [Kiritimatiellia bacterium]
MSDYIDMEQVDSRLKDIERMYSNETLLRRLKVLFSGLKAPRQSREYKAAMIEMQRLSAPVAAFFLPAVAVALLIVMSSGASVEDRIIETQVLEAEEIKDLDKIEEFDRPEEQVENMDIDIPITSPDVQVQADTPNQPVSPQPQAFDAVMTVKSPVILKNIYGSTRNTGTRGVQLAKFGGDPRTEEAVMRALRWLKKNQQPDGSWQRQKIAMTGLAILTFLAHGEKPGESVEFGVTVQKALEFLLKSQRADGKFNGMDGNEYAHPIATYALCEAYGMTLNPNVKAAAEKALVPIIKGQHPTGGWTYKMKPGVEEGDGHGAAGKYRDDTSFMGWCAQALKAAKLAKLHADGLDKAMKLAVKGFKANAHPSGGFGYVGPGTGGLTSVGCLCMQLLGASNEPEVKRALDVIGTWTPSFSQYAPVSEVIKQVKPDELVKKDKTGKPVLDKNGKEEKRSPREVAKSKLAAKVPEEERKFFTASAQYYFYYATQCKFHEGGKHWDNWNKAMKPRYLKAQLVQEKAIKDDKGVDRDIGWWENADTHTDRPVMDTCLAALQLMVYYRYLPTTSKEAVQVEEEIVATSTDTDDIKVDTGNL